MEIHIENLQKKVTLNPRAVMTIAKRTLQSESVKKATLTIVFVTSHKIRALNKKFLKRNYTTDVLAFDLKGNGTKAKHIKKEVMGDVIICADQAIKNALSFNSSVAQEISLYVIHGILHLLGYEDHTSKGKKLMMSRQLDILNSLASAVNKVNRIS